MRSLLILSSLFCFACHSKPTKTEPVPPPVNEKASGEGKVTAEPPAAPRELLTMVKYAPRRKVEVESAISLNKDLQTCFRGQPVESPLTLRFEAHVSFQGELERLKFKDATPEMEGCLTTALKGVILGRGKIGPLRVDLSTDRSKFPKAKGLALDPIDVKKFE